MILLLLLLLPQILHASIFGADDRLDYFEIDDPIIQKVSNSTPALVRKKMMQKLPNGNFKMIGSSLKEKFNFCADSLFSNDPFNANCSAALIDKDKILTAAHCVNKKNSFEMGINDYYVVFDYKRTDLKENEYIIPNKNVYTLEKEIYYQFDPYLTTHALDLAIYKLNKAVDRKPLHVNVNYEYTQMNKIFILGYPLGIPLKLTPNGYINNKNAAKNSFRHNLDTFSVNSGSPIFDASTMNIIGVHVRGTGSNFKRYERECNDWFRAHSSNDYGEANTLTILKDKL